METTPLLEEHNREQSKTKPVPHIGKNEKDMKTEPDPHNHESNKVTVGKTETTATETTESTETPKQDDVAVDII